MLRPLRTSSPAGPTRYALSRDGWLRRLVKLSIAGVPAALALGAPTTANATFYGTSGVSAQPPPTASPAGGKDSGSTTTTPTSGTGVTSPDVALQRADRSLRDLHNALEAVTAAREQQRAAHQLAISIDSIVPDGHIAGGLMEASGAIKQTGAACAAGGDCLWVNAELPTQTTEAGRQIVTVDQTDQKAILTWQSFNVGRNTTLHIDQSAGTQKDGNNDWVALNRVSANTSPTQILGQIKAEGSVYIINQNGILFDASSSVDVHSLLASTLPLYLPVTASSLTNLSADAIRASNQLFLNTGLTSVGPGTADGSPLGIVGGGSISVANADALAAVLPGDLTIEEGARISVSNNGYFVGAAPNVFQHGWIDATDSEVVLAAGLGVQLNNNSAGGRFTVATGGRVNDASQDGADITPLSEVQNDGLIQSQRGSVIVAGSRIDQAGVIEATTSVSRLGSVELRATEQLVGTTRTGSVNINDGSVTTILPDSSAEATNSSAAASTLFKPLGVTVTGGSINVESGALIEAPGHNVSLTAIAQDDATVSAAGVDGGQIAGRVYIGPDAVVDVAGLANVELPILSVLLNIPRIGLNELADSPLQRNGPLFGASITIDTRITGVRDDGVKWVGTPLANLQGYVDQVPRQVRQLLTNAGSIRLIGNEVIANRGSVLNLAGGYVHYLGGVLNPTRLVTASGTLVDIGGADPNVQYVGFAGQYLDRHPRWNVTNTYSNPTLAAALTNVFEADDVQGGSAGTLTVFGQSTALIGATLDAHAVSGRSQTLAGNIAPGGTVVFGGKFSGSVFPNGALVTAGPSYVVKESLPDELFNDIADATSELPERGDNASERSDIRWWTPVSAQQMRDAGVSNVRIVADVPDALNMGGEIVVEAGTDLSVTPRGSINFTASRITVEDGARLRANAGSINLLSTGRTFLPDTTVGQAAGDGNFLPGDIVIGAGAVLDASGMFVNDLNLGNDRITGGAYINGGTISLATQQNSAPSVDDEETIVDLTGSIRLAQGSVLNVSSGARVLPTGAIASSNGIFSGSGGHLSLQTYTVADSPFGRNDTLALPTLMPSENGRVVLGGALLGFGFSNGATLTLRAPELQIGGNPPTGKPWTLTLAPSFFTDNGFSRFELYSEYDATINAGTVLTPTQLNWLPTYDSSNLPVMLGLATGANLSAAPTAGGQKPITLTRLDDVHRKPVDLSLYSGDYLTWGQRDPNDPLLVTPPVFLDPVTKKPIVTGELDIQPTAQVLGDPGARLVFGSHRRVVLEGEIVAHGGDVTLTADSARGGYAQNPGVVVDGDAYADGAKAVWLGEHSLIDVSGTTVIDPIESHGGTVPRGNVLDGGNVVITADDGYIVALNCNDVGDCPQSQTKSAAAAASDPSAAAASATIEPKFGNNGGGSGGGSGSGGSSGVFPGATINVSGAQGTVGVFHPITGLSSPETLLSDAGTITLGAGAGLFFNGTLIGKAGGGGAQGGSLAIVPEIGVLGTTSGFAGATRLVLSATGVAMPEGALTPGSSISGADTDGNEILPTGVLNFSTASLTDSGITGLYLGTDPNLGNSPSPVPIDITSSLDLELRRSLIINTLLLSGIALPPENHPKPIDVALSAPYVSLHGYERGGDYSDLHKIVGQAPWTRESISQLSISANAIDVGGQIAIEGFSDVTLTGRDEIRFITPPAFSNVSDGANGFQQMPTALFVGGNLNLKAGRIYPATGQSAVIYADNSHYDRKITKVPLRDDDGNLISDDGTFVNINGEQVDLDTDCGKGAACRVDADGNFINDKGFIVDPSTTCGNAPCRIGDAGDFINSSGFVVEPDSTCGNVPCRIDENGDLINSSGRVVDSDGTLVLDDNNHSIPGGAPVREEPVPSDPVLLAHTPVESQVVTPVASNATVHFEKAGSDLGAPLSAGGSLLVSAANINQEGRLYAPGGQIILGTQALGRDHTQTLLGRLLGLDDDLNLDPTARYTGLVGVPVDLVDSQVSSDRLLLLPEAFAVQTRTSNVTFGKNSLTSVSLNGLQLPYGRTRDGQNLVFNGTGNRDATVRDLGQSPDARVAAVGDNVQLNKGAVVDLSGGGDLIASEWIAGTGGSRDVLAQQQLSFTSGTPTLVPTYADNRPIYAILPGYKGVAPFDPEYQSDPLIGKSVYLSGIDGLPAGNYTLLPASYALLPGAFRLVQDTRAGARDAVDNQVNQTLSDGTLKIAGYFTDTFSGAREARTATFLVQSAPVWRQYSEYQLTSLNNYFTALSAQDNKILHAPGDAGTLALSAINTMTLDANILAAAPQGRLGPELQFAAPRLQVTSGGDNASSSILTLDADRLNQFNARRIVLGATTDVSLGTETFNVVSENVNIATVGAPLRAGEVIAVSQHMQDGDGVTVAEGAAIEAVGNRTGRDGLPISIGSAPTLFDDSGNPLNAITGDGAFLQVSVNNANLPSRDYVTGAAGGPAGEAQGDLHVGRSARLIAPGSITLDATGTTSIGAGTQLSTHQLAADASSVTVGDSDPPHTTPEGLYIGPALQSQLAGIAQVSLLSRNQIKLDGNPSLSAAERLELSAGRIVSDGGTATLHAPTVVFDNLLGAPTGSPSSDAAGSLSVGAENIVFGNPQNPGDVRFDGFESATLTASKEIEAAGRGRFDFESTALHLSTPAVVADGRADATLSTLGALVANGTGAAPPSVSDALGGRVRLQGGSLDVDTAVLAPAGQVELNALGGDLHLGGNALISAAGAHRHIFDTDVVASAGSVDLISEQGSIVADAGSRLDVSADAIGGGAGSLSLSAVHGGITLDGALLGHHASGARGAELTLDSGDPLSLDTIAGLMSSGGIDGALNAHTRHGNLELSAGHTLVAADVQLVADASPDLARADNGRVVIDGVIDAHGVRGGEVALFGHNGVAVDGTVDAHGTASDQRGGALTIGVGGDADGRVDDALGYERIAAANAGVIHIGDAAHIDVSGGSRAGHSGGEILVRAPILDDHSLPIEIASGADIRGASRPLVEATARWDTVDASTGALHFDGVIDPAGTTGADRAAFVAQTLAQFIQNPGAALGLPDTADAQWRLRAGVELVNSSTEVLDGNIEVASDWNLAAGTLDAQGAPVLALRTGDVAPAISLRAVGDLDVRASLSDGFFAIAASPLPLATASLLGMQGAQPYDSSSLRLAAGADTSSVDPLMLSDAARRDRTGHLLVSGHETAALGARTAVTPTMIRTGVGSIDIATAGDVRLLDADAPGVIYTAGHADVSGAVLPAFVLAVARAGNPAILDSGNAQPQGAGDIRIDAGGDIQGLALASVNSARFGQIEVAIATTDANGSRTGTPGADLNQYWWPWMQRSCLLSAIGCQGAPENSSLNFAMFDQGVLSAGGDVAIHADGSVRDLSVSLPTTWRRSDGAVQTFGGGDLRLSVGDDLIGGSAFVGSGRADIHAGGAIAADRTLTTADLGLDPLSLDSQLRPRTMLLALQDAQMDVSAGRGVNIGGVFNPSYLFSGFDSQSYTPTSSVNVLSESGNLQLGTFGSAVPGASYGAGSLDQGLAYLLPATLEAAAPLGSMTVRSAGELYPSSTGELSLIARDNLQLVAQFNNQYFGLIDAPAALLPSPDNPITAASVRRSFINDGGVQVSQRLHSPDALHDGDDQPLRIYSERGSIINGDDSVSLVGTVAQQSYARSMLVAADKPASIRAGLDIVNLYFTGQNLHDSDITTIAAGRDIYDPPLLPAQTVPLIELGGPGTLSLSAGRNIGPLTSANDARSLGYLFLGNPQYPGIRTVGNANNVYLQRDGAAISLRYGVAHGMATQEFADAYINPAPSTSVAVAREHEGLTGVIHCTTDNPCFVSVDDPSLIVRFKPDPNTQHVPDSVASANTISVSVAHNGEPSSGGGTNLFVKFVGDLPGLQIALDSGKGNVYGGTHADTVDVSRYHVGQSFQQQLISFVTQYESDHGGVIPASAGAAWSEFTTLPAEQQQNFVSSVFLQVLDITGLDYNDPNGSFAGQYARGYQAVASLFPSELGYTENALGGTRNGALNKIRTGTLDMRGTTVQTQAGGDISILGPGGPIVVGSASAPPFAPETGNTAAIGPNSQGILTLESGSVRIFADQSVLLAQSRIFTEQGGDILIWSSNGDINAGKGAKTSSEIPPLKFTCDDDLFCLVDARSQVSGAGIAALQNTPDAPAGSVDLIAPVGTVDFGEAGVRANNLNVAAQQVANADNVQVQGSKAGVPTGLVDTAAISVASSVAAAVSQTADQLAASHAPGQAELDLFVEILTPADEQDKPKDAPQ